MTRPDSFLTFKARAAASNGQGLLIFRYTTGKSTGARLLQSFLIGLLLLPAALAYAQDEATGRLHSDEAPLTRWKSEDGQELYELRTTEDTFILSASRRLRIACTESTS